MEEIKAELKTVKLSNSKDGSASLARSKKVSKNSKSVK